MRLRLILSFALIVFIAIATVLIIAQQGAATEVRMFMRGPMMGVDSLARDLERYYIQMGSWQGAEALLADSRGRRGMGMVAGLNLRLAEANGTVVAVSQGEPSGRLTRSERQAAVELNDRSGEVIGYLLSEATGIASSERQLITRLLRAGLIAAAVSGGLALLIALLLSYGLLKPVNELTRAAERMAGGDLSQRVQVGQNDEMGTLGRAFNQMAASLQRAERNRQMMTADIAHELRTPIAIQRAHLEALQDGIYPLTIEHLQPVLDQTEMLTRLVDDLRTLALVDAGELHLEHEAVDLPALVRRVVERFRPEAENRQVEMFVEDGAFDSSEKISLDSGRIEQILNNLFSNALRYTQEGGRVIVELSRHNGWAEVQVKDNGQGIPPEAVPHLFERFFRVDKSRSRAAGGTGLGLAIARQLSLAHGGNLSAANLPEGGAVFILKLPDVHMQN
jgi:signal transduction histidine kinase